MIGTLPAWIVAELATQAEDASPAEACGFVAVDQAGTAVRMYAVPNRAAGLGAYTIDPADLFAVISDTERRGWEIGAIYHSHPSGPSRPSRTDLDSAIDPEWLSLIVSPQGDAWIVKAFRIAGRKAIPVELDGIGPGYPVAVPRPSTT